MTDSSPVVPTDVVGEVYADASDRMTLIPQQETPPAMDDPPPNTSSEAVIQCAGLSKVFRDFWLRNRVRAVDGIDLTVNRGEVFGLLGPNGSGKTTTIKLILGLLHPTAGRVIVLGKRPDSVAVKNWIGYLPEESYLYRFLSARETLEYFARLFRLGAAQRKQRIDTLLQMVGLDAVQHRPVGEYSKGMQRRIGLAQALINDPQLLILDEPTAGLDPIGTRQIKDLIRELARRGKTILLCSHLLADVEDVCDRVAVMFGGKIRAMDTVDQLLTQQDVTLLKTQRLDEQMIRTIEKSLQAQGKHIETVEQPRISLESLFLEIVRQAQEQDATTSGAHSSGRIAPFLVGTDPAPASSKSVATSANQPEKPSTELVDSLMGRWQTKTEDHLEGATDDSASSDPIDTPPTPEAIAGLTNSPTAPEQSTGASGTDEYPPVDNEVLDNLISGLPEEQAGSDEESRGTLAAEETGPSEEAVSGEERGSHNAVNRPDVPTSSSASAGAEQDDESPDNSFLDAITWVPPYEDDGKKASDDGEEPRNPGAG